MKQHQTSNQDQWFHSRYAGEDQDDGCQNELSIKPSQEEANRKQSLLIRIDKMSARYQMFLI